MTKNTGAVMNGGSCPGCGTTIYGMMPQRCFMCGYDFTNQIKAQNPDFHPDPNFKSPIGDVQDEIRAVADREALQIIAQQYGSPCETNCDHEYCKLMRAEAHRVMTQEAKVADLAGDGLGLADMLNQEMDRQREVGAKLQREADELLQGCMKEQRGMEPPDVAFLRAVKARWPFAHIQIWAEKDGAVCGRIEHTADRIIVEVDSRKQTS